MKKLLFSPFLFLGIFGYTEMVDIGPTVIGDAVMMNVLNNGSMSATNLVLDAADEKVFFVTRVSKTTNIRKVGFPTGTTTTGDTLPVRIETLSETGIPTGTLLCTNSSATVVIGNNDDSVWKETSNMVADCSVSTGTELGIVIQRAGSFNGQIARLGSANYVGGFSYVGSSIGASGYTRIATPPSLALYASDGSTIPLAGIYPAYQANAVTFMNTTNPNTRGVTFQFPTDFRCSGIAFVGAEVTTSTVYTANAWLNNTAIATATLNGNNVATVGNGASHHYFWDTGSFVGTANQQYRFTFTVTSSSLTLRNIVFNDASLMKDYIPFGETMYLTTAMDPNSGGAWTDTNNIRIFIAPIIDQVDSNSGSSFMTAQ